MGFFAALSAIKEIILGLKAVFAFIEANKREAWFTDSADTFRNLKKAETKEDYQKAADNLRDLLRRL